MTKKTQITPAEPSRSEWRVLTEAAEKYGENIWAALEDKERHGAMFMLMCREYLEPPSGYDGKRRAILDKSMAKTKPTAPSFRLEGHITEEGVAAIEKRDKAGRNSTSNVIMGAWKRLSGQRDGEREG